jgi:hypothetical protein
MKTEKNSDKIVCKGDVFYTSWGYDQTNYDFLVVESVSGTGKTAYCRMAVVDCVSTNGFVDELKPRVTGYGITFPMRIKEGYAGDGAALRGSYPFCKNDQTAKRLGTFMRVDKNRIYGQTNPMVGH